MCRSILLFLVLWVKMLSLLSQGKVASFGVSKSGDIFFPALVPVLSGPAAPTPEYHRHLMAVLLFLPSAQVRGLEAPLCPASELRVSVGIPRGPEFSGRMAQGLPLARGGTDARPVSSPSSLLDFLSRPRGPVSVPCQSWDTSSNLSLYPYLISASLCWGNHHIAPSCPWQQARTFSPFPRR